MGIGRIVKKAGRTVKRTFKAGGGAVMGALGLKTPKIEIEYPKPQETAPEVPDVGKATEDAYAREQEDAMLKRKRKGRAATLLSGGAGGAGLPTTAAKSLLGE